MAYEGHTPEYPVCVASAVILDPFGRNMLTGSRCETPNERRHLRTLSTITRRVPRGVFALLAGGDPGSWPIGSEPLPKSGGNRAAIGSDEHGTSPDVFVVESVLGKLGLSGALAEAAITGTISPSRRSLSLVKDKDTDQSEWTAMLHYVVNLDVSSDLSAIPKHTASYAPIVWVPADRVSLAYDTGDVGQFGDLALDKLFLCVAGACMSGAAEILRSD